MKFAEGADDTGVIIPYNTQAPDTVTGTNPVVLGGALAINPITWTRDETLASASQNMGSIMLNPGGSVVLDSDGNFLKVMNYADAQVDTAKGVLVCSTADENRLAPGEMRPSAGACTTASTTPSTTTIFAKMPRIGWRSV